MSFVILQKIFVQFFLNLFYFPIWWYSEGLKRAALLCGKMIEEGNANLGPGLWLRNIFVPMFGQRDWQGRIMSFFMRLVNVIGRGFGLLVWILVVFFLFLLWVTVPVLVVYQTLQSLLSW